jgi:hypothetical protein
MASSIHEYGVQDMPKRKTDKLARVKARPDPARWAEDEVMTLIEAAAVFFSPRSIDIIVVAQSSDRRDS